MEPRKWGLCIDVFPFPNGVFSGCLGTPDLGGSIFRAKSGVTISAEGLLCHLHIPGIDRSQWWEGPVGMEEKGV